MQGSEQLNTFLFIFAQTNTLTMAAPEGNQYALNNDGGRPMAFETPEQWKEAIDSYFAWCDANPILKNEVVKTGTEAGRILPVPTQRPYLIEGLCDFLNISVETFRNYEKKEGYDVFFAVSAYARNKVYAQNLTFGYTGGFDAGLVARKLGIADKQEMKAEVRQTQIIVRNDHEKAVMESVLSKE